MVRGQSRERRANDTGVMDVDLAAIVNLVQRCHGQKGGKAPESANGTGRMSEAVMVEVMLSQRVPPVVEIAGDHSRQMGEFQERAVIEQV